jgi:hypothetical protein
MLIAKGYRIVLFKVGYRAGAKKKAIRLPAKYALLHDVNGTDWPSCSALIASFTRSRSKIPSRSDTGPAVKYFNYEPQGGHMSLPPKRLSDWKRVGEIGDMTYIRPGDKEGLGDNLLYGHEFKNTIPVLYKLGRTYRLELGAGCVWNWRGIVT